MSKELTEQLRNGTLEDGLYYALTSTFRFNEESVIERAINGVLYINGVVDFNVKEVLAKVPTYDQFSQLLKKIEELGKENSELVQKVHILNEANMKLENAIGSHADYFQQQISVLESKLSEANDIIKFYANADQLTEEEKQMTAEKYHLVYGLKANDYLTKHGWSK